MYLEEGSFLDSTLDSTITLVPLPTRQRASGDLVTGGKREDMDMGMESLVVLSSMAMQPPSILFSFGLYKQEKDICRGCSS